MFGVFRVWGVSVFWVNHIVEGQGDQGGGPKVAKIQYGVKPDILKNYPGGLRLLPAVRGDANECRVQTLSPFAQERELAWWSWEWKWAAVGPKRLGRHAGENTREIRSPVLQRRLEQAWRLRWCSILSCAAARALSNYLVGVRRAWC